MVITLPKWTPLIAAILAGAFACGWVLGGAADHGWWTEVTAAWVQGVGSIAAIGVAIFVDRRSARREVERREAEARDRREAAGTAIRVALDVLLDVEAGLKKPPGRPLSVLAAEILRAETLLDHFSTDHMATPNTVNALVLARSRLPRFRAMLESYDGSDQKWEALQTQAARASETARDAMLQFEAGPIARATGRA